MNKEEAEKMIGIIKEFNVCPCTVGKWVDIPSPMSTYQDEEAEKMLRLVKYIYSLVKEQPYAPIYAKDQE